MIRSKLRDYAGDTVRFACQKCGRAGEYSKQHLIWRFGPGISLLDLGVRIANCERERDACGVHFIDLIDR